MENVLSYTREYLPNYTVSQVRDQLMREAQLSELCVYRYFSLSFLLISNSVHVDFMYTSRLFCAGKQKGYS